MRLIWVGGRERINPLVTCGRVTAARWPDQAVPLTVRIRWGVRAIVNLAQHLGEGMEEPIPLPSAEGALRGKGKREREGKRVWRCSLLDAFHLSYLAELERQEEEDRPLAKVSKRSRRREQKEGAVSRRRPGLE